MDVVSDAVDELYTIFNKIKENQNSGKSSENPALFEKILAAAGSSSDAKSKRLAAQFMCRLFGELSETQQKAAYNALIDLVEEDDVQTRKQVISGLPKLCRCRAKEASGSGGGVGNSHVAKVADVLVQLLQTDDDQELALVQQALLQVLNCNALEAVEGIFGQINHDDVADVARLRAIKFLADRLLCVDRGQMTPRVEDAIVAQVDKALEDVSEEEFVCFVRVLASLQCMQTLGGRQRLVDMICQQADFGGAFDPADAACVAKVRGCAKQALPFLSRNIKAEKFVIYFLDKVLPAIGAVPEEAEGGHRPRLDLLRRFADLTGHAGPGFCPTDAQMASLLSCIEALMPQPPKSSSDSADSVAEDLNFSEAECLLLALHHLAKARASNSPSSSSSSAASGGSGGGDYFADRPAELAQLRKRLQYFLLATQAHERSLKKSTTGAANKSATAGPVLSTALATTGNVAQLIRELFKHPPAYRPDAVSTPSWRRERAKPRPLPQPPASSSSASASAAAASGAAAGTGTGSSSRKRRAVDLPVYRPPAGKFSAGVRGVPRGGGGGGGASYGGRSRYYNVYTT